MEMNEQSNGSAKNKYFFVNNFLIIINFTKKLALKMYRVSFLRKNISVSKKNKNIIYLYFLFIIFKTNALTLLVN